MRRAKRFNHDESELSPRIMLLPLIDIFMVLLVIVMVTVPVTQHVLKVYLPSSDITDKKDANRKELVISIDKNKGLFLNGTPVELSLLKTVLEKQQEIEKAAVFVQADKSLAYEYIVQVIKTIKKAKVRHVILATQRAS